MLGPQTYDTARQLTESEDWEKEVKGLEMIVAISRDSPEVSEWYCCGGPNLTTLENDSGLDYDFSSSLRFT